MDEIEAVEIDEENVRPMDASRGDMKVPVRQIASSQLSHSRRR
jgi:hypothetical protein